MAPGLRYVNGEVTRGFFFFARLRHRGGGYFTFPKCDASGLQMKNTGVYKRFSEIIRNYLIFRRY
ncbi:MAG: hypothetical protein BVN29_02440 [Nitrospira sp. ST-bin5]|nr:MAG: hypothetical protein BVN29_02440 [Nitrospira sp. ST-bin5]